MLVIDGKVETVNKTTEDWLEDYSKQKVEEKEQLFRLHLKHPKIKELRGSGLMLAIEFEDEKLAKKVVEQCFEKGLILFYFLFTKTTIRITPPLTISNKEIIEGSKIIKEILEI